jgi:hypothetical protein
MAAFLLLSWITYSLPIDREQKMIWKSDFEAKDRNNIMWAGKFARGSRVPIARARAFPFLFIFPTPTHAFHVR